MKKEPAMPSIMNSTDEPIKGYPYLNGRKGATNEGKRTRQVPKTPADWGDAKPDLLARAIRLVTGDGDAIMFGLTSDGGAFVTNIYHSGRANKEYIPGNDNIDEFLEGIIRDYEP